MIALLPQSGQRHLRANGLADERQLHWLSGCFMASLLPATNQIITSTVDDGALHGSEQIWANQLGLSGRKEKSMGPVGPMRHQPDQLAGVQAIFCRRRHQPRRPPLAGAGWLHEIKRDGFRIVARKNWRAGERR
jgi:ATP-dependent DNA ligase